MKNLKKINKNNINGIWFYGLSGSGKTTASIFIKEKYFKNSIIFDGDVVRKYLSSDLGYSLKDREMQLLRILGLCQLSLNSKAFPICSTVYMNKKTSIKLQKLKILLIKIERDFEDIKKYKVYKLKKNVVGVDMNYEKKISSYVLLNDKKIDFYQSLKKIFQK